MANQMTKAQFSPSGLCSLGSFSSEPGPPLRASPEINLKDLWLALVIAFQASPCVMPARYPFAGSWRLQEKDADKSKLSTPKRSIDLGQSEVARARSAAKKARRIAGNDALNRIQPGNNLIAFPVQP